MSNKDGKGFVTFAMNMGEVDYLRLAYLQALNVKTTQQDAKYAVVTNVLNNDIPDKYKSVFDHIIYVPSNTVRNAFDVEPYIFDLTPFKETIKIESDLLFTRSIDHWWTAFRLKDVCLSYHAKDYYGIESAVRKYRELFDANNLPDTYNGLMYFRYSQQAHDFFESAKYLNREWATVAVTLQKCVEETPTTDVLYALAALMSEESVYMPSMDFINFVHMKSEFNGWSDNRSWVDTVMNERDGDVIRINNLNQYFPVHYYDKDYATDELIEYYEQRVLGRV